jgi:sec-independent protein translocase protein TatA
MPFNIRGSEWLIILLIVLLFFGASRLPALMKSLGQSWRIFRDEVREEPPANNSAPAVIDGAEPVASNTASPPPESTNATQPAPPGNSSR